MRRLVALKAQRLLQLMPVGLGPSLLHRHFANPRKQAEKHQRQDSL